MGLVVIILVFLLVVTIGIVINNYLNLRKMNQQLERIINQFGTNERLKTDLSNKELNLFVKQVNQLITLFKNEEQQTIRKNKKLREEITNISHDLRTPLTSIKGFSELLEDTSLTQNERADYLRIIQKKITLLEKTVNNFYEVSRLESEEDNFEYESVQIGEILIEVMLSFQKDFEKEKLKVIIDETSFQTPIWVDRKATERIFLNVIQNALRYSRSFLEIKVNKTNKFLVVTIINDSEIISKEDMQHIFDRSFTIDKSRQQGQTGFGLYIIEQLVKKQNGQVKAIFQDELFTLELEFPLFEYKDK